MEGDFRTGCYRVEQRVKADAEPIDDVNKFAWLPEDIEEVTVWHEYDEGELAFQEELRVSAIRAEFNEQLPDNIADVQEAIVELGDMAADAEVSNAELMDAIAELGMLVSEFLEVANG